MYHDRPSENVQAAIAQSDWVHYVTTQDGRLPQTTRPDLIAALVAMLDPQDGERILEIGTGSGYSAEVLSRLVGSSGAVVTVDIVPELIERAATRHAARKLSNVEAVVGDGHRGCPGRAPFDRVIAWATARRLPGSWAEQLREGGVIVAPTHLLPQAGCVASVRLRKTADGTLAGEGVAFGSFAPLDDAPRRQWSLGPGEDADVVVMEAVENMPLWLSSAWLSQEPDQRRRELATAFLRHRSQAGGPVLRQREAQAFHAYLMATNPAGLTTGHVPASGLCVGYSDPAAIALLSLHEGAPFVAGEPHALGSLLEWVGSWRAAGCPGFDRLDAVANPAGPDFAVRARLRCSRPAREPRA